MLIQINAGLAAPICAGNPRVDGQRGVRMLTTTATTQSKRYPTRERADGWAENALGMSDGCVDGSLSATGLRMRPEINRSVPRRISYDPEDRGKHKGETKH